MERQVVREAEKQVSGSFDDVANLVSQLKL